MTYLLSARDLYGYSMEKVALMGMPSVGSYYLTENADNYTLRDNARCVVCGKPATNSHHLVPRGYMRHFLLKTHEGQFVTLSPLFALCGSGTQGCHGKFHSGQYKARWVWESDFFEEKWFLGQLQSCALPGSPNLFNFGHYEILCNGRVIDTVGRSA